MKNSDKVMNQTQAAEMLATTPQRMKKMREDGNGPPFQKLGPRTFRYSLHAIQQWLKQQQPNRQGSRSEEASA
jgi:hypothetical protein